jgi:hypothetical protein
MGMGLLVESLHFNRGILPLCFLVILFFGVLPVHAFVSGGTIAGTVVSVFPEKLTVKVNETFKIFVNISGVEKLQGFDFMLAYDTRILDCLGVEEGDFLQRFGPTFVAKSEVNDSFAFDRGRVWFVAVIYGDGYADGNGSLAVVSFKAVAVGETVLDLYSDFPLRRDEVKLTTCGSQAIPNRAVDGLVIVVANEGGCDDNDDPPPTSDPVDPPSIDVNGDGVVNIRDLALVALAYGTVDGDSKYNSRVDFNLDGVVDIRDITVVAQNYGQRI